MKKIILLMTIITGSFVSAGSTSQATASPYSLSTYFVKDGYHIEVFHDYSGNIFDMEVTIAGPGSPGFNYNLWPGPYMTYLGDPDEWCFTGSINVEDPNLGWVQLDITCNN